MLHCGSPGSSSTANSGAPGQSQRQITVHAFRYKVLRELKKIKLAWPDLHYTTPPGLLILHPSIPAIAPLNQGQLTS